MGDELSVSGAMVDLYVLVPRCPPQAEHLTIEAGIGRGLRGLRARTSLPVRGAR